MNPDPEVAENYQKRRAEFLKAKENASSQILRNSLAEAIAHADISAEIFLKIVVPSLDSYTKRVRNDSENALTKNSGGELAAIEKQMTEAEKRGDIETVRNLVNRLKLQKEETVRAKEALEKSQEICKVVGNSASKLFGEIFASDDSNRSLDAVLELVDFVIGMTPVGDFVSGYQKIHSILTRQKTEINDAGKYLGKVENFLSATYFWALLAYQTACNLNACSEREKIDLQKAHDKILEMLSQKKILMVWYPPAELIFTPSKHE